MPILLHYHQIVLQGFRGFTHARRRFDAALTALKKDFTKEQLKETVAYQAMARIGASAVVYSITETALLNGVKPYLYLTYVLDQLRRMDPFPKPEDLDRLLPWSGFRKNFEQKNKI